MRSIATDFTHVSVCVLGTRVSCAKKRLNRSRCRLGLTSVRPMNRVLDGGSRCPSREEALLMGHVLAHGNVPTTCECACPELSADDYLRRCVGWQLGVWTLAFVRHNSQPLFCISVEDSLAAPGLIYSSFTSADNY